LKADKILEKLVLVLSKKDLAQPETSAKVNTHKKTVNRGNRNRKIISKNVLV